jgi:hypothetical protein
MGELWAVLTWLGSGAVLTILAWLSKLPQKLWQRFQLWVVFKHGKIPRRTLLVATRTVMWHFGASAKQPATQLYIRLTVTNITADTEVSLIEAQFRRSWRRQVYRFGGVGVIDQNVWRDAVLAPGAVVEVAVDGFIVPRIEWKNKSFRGTLTLVDQFHNKCSIKVVVSPGADVPTGVEREQEKLRRGEYRTEEPDR